MISTVNFRPMMPALSISENSVFRAVLRTAKRAKRTVSIIVSRVAPCTVAMNALHKFLRWPGRSSSTAARRCGSGTTPCISWLRLVAVFLQSRFSAKPESLIKPLGGCSARFARCCPRETCNWTVEIDETYYGGKRKGGHGRQLRNDKGEEMYAPVFGMVERKGRVRAFATPN